MPTEEVRVDNFLVADDAKSFQGKLYIHGGGWNYINVAGPNSAKSISIAGRVVVPWSEAVRVVNLRIHLERTEADGAGSVVAPIARLSLSPKGPGDQSESPETATPFALEIGDVSFSLPGIYAFIVRDEERELARARFQVNFTGRGKTLQVGTQIPEEDILK